MTFEEFFKKKRIDLVALGQAEPGLLFEFRTHFEQMGEKSFDHTKKYWFNKLRLQYVLAPEVKTEKVKIDNPLAEQTITDSLEQHPAPAPGVGFRPKFRAASLPATGADKPTEEVKTESPAQPPGTPAAPKPGFTPRFKAATMPKPAPENIEEIKAESQASPPATPPAPKPGFTPRFKAANMPKPVAEDKEGTPPSPVENKAASEDAPLPKPAYKPRFNVNNIPKKEE